MHESVVTLREQIAELESVSRTLEPNAEERRRLLDQVARYGEKFLETIEERRAYIADDHPDSPFVFGDLDVQPAPIGALLEEMDGFLDHRGINPASGGHLGYIPGGGVYPSSLGDYLADITNRYAGIYFANPGAVEMENMMIDWLAAAVGFPKGTAGNLASGGSVANLTAIVTARDASGMRAADYSRACIYMTKQVHHCVSKAIRIAGLGEAHIRWISVDESNRMDADALQAEVDQDRAAGLKPFMIVASAGTTDTGAVDPLDAIADVSDTAGTWFHIDGAYGALFNLVDEVKPLFKGMDRADSIVVDPHKTLFLPYGTGAVLIKDSRAMFQSHRYTANYMQDALEAGSVLSPADLSPELTKHFRGLRMWLPLKLFGTEPFVAGLHEKLLLARYFRNEVARIDGIEVGPEPDLSVVTFRYVPDSGDANEINRRIVEAIQRDGRVFLSSTMLGDVYTIRMAAVCFRTHLRTIDLALEVIREAIRTSVGGSA